MNIRPEELSEHSFVLLDKLDHKELVPFIRLYMKKRNKFSIFYYLVNFMIFGFAGFYFVSGFHDPEYSFADRFLYFSYGLAMSLLLMPLHEYIHGLAYKSQGAQNTSYDANLRKFYFMALADKFVANRKEFQIVALAPFVVISIILIVMIVLSNADWKIAFMACLLAHTSMCSGDFGLLSYFEYHKKQDLVTYDDVENKTSYFYSRNQI